MSLDDLPLNSANSKPDTAYFLEGVTNCRPQVGGMGLMIGRLK